MPSHTLLITSCNPPDAHPLQVDRIVRKIRTVLDRTSIEIEQFPDLHFFDLEAQLRRHRPALFQFIGHGLPDGRLVMKRQSELVEDVAAEAVIGVMRQAPERPRVVVLTACYTEALADGLVRAGVPCVIGTQDRTPDESLDAFSTAFYRALGEGSSVGDAFRSGRAAVAGETEGLSDLFCLREAADGVADGLRFGPPGIVIDEAPGAPPALALNRVRQVIVWLDVDQEQPSQEEVELQLPAERRGERAWRRLSDFNGPRLDRDRAPRAVPWAWLSRAIASLGRELRAQAKADPDPMRYYVVGRAPLAAFAQLGSELSGWSAPVTFLNRRMTTGGWDVIPLDAPQRDRPFFDRVEGLEGISEAQGRLDLYVSCFGDAPPPAVQRFAPPGAEGRIGRVVLSTQACNEVDLENGSRIVAEVKTATSRLRTVWPEHRGLTVFVRGPAVLAFIVGRALNPRLHRTHLPDFVSGDYLPAISLPLDASEPAPVNYEDPQGRLERERVLRRLRDSVLGTRAHLRAEHLRPPRRMLDPGPDTDRLAARLLRHLGDLDFDPEPSQDAFEFSVFHRKLSIGVGFLEGLRPLAPATLDLLGPLFVLHELLHLDQHLTGRRYRGVGRAGFVLEEVDASADAFALLALTRLRLARGGPEAVERCPHVLVELIDAHVGALMAFDRMECGDRIDELPERRLRRYLMWALQRARAATARRPEHLEQILDDRLVIELAPLRSTLSAQYDKVVDGPTDQTELFIGRGGRLVRLASSPQNFQPGDLIESVRAMRWPEVCSAMETVVELAHADLVPWVDAD